MEHVEEHQLAPPAEEHKLLDRPAEERLREQLEAQTKQQQQRKEKKPDEDKPKHPSRKVLWLIALGILIIILLVFFLGYLPRHRREKQLQTESRRERDSLPIAYVTPVRRSPATVELMLPGNVTALQEASIYARASGYVRKRYADIGDRVREGQLLAEIEAPELDQQVAQARAAVSQAEAQSRQARADLETSKSNLDLATVTYNRYRVLVEHGVLARQEGDQQAANLRTAQANVRAAEETVRASEDNVRAARANLERVIALQAFERVRAPFSGVVTARNFDVGALISANGAGLGSSINSPPSGGSSGASTGGGSAPSGNSTGGGGELFRIAQIGTLRILINVPQGNAPTIQVGQAADLFVQEFSKDPFRGHITRTANSIDPASRTLLTEVQVPNPNGRLLPGMYAQVQLINTRSNPPLLVPGDAIVTRAGGNLVAMLVDPTPEEKRQQAQKDRELKQDEQQGSGNNNGDQQALTRQQQAPAKQVHLQRVEVGRDYGTDVEITGGLKGSEYLVVNPGDTIREGALVRPAASANQASKSAGPGGPSDKRPSTISSPGEAALSQSAGPNSRSGGNQGGGNENKSGSAGRGASRNQNQQPR